ncbi:MAG: mucoidy inhibitor MuiA family protein [Gammaproteobacteria bacterium]|nr:mucoidy inhibitor MuiA family protein [Gammaproteobacteria bacterium]MYF66899.1 mucoidy inhibitor MuiA family protein [Gammaproteobacteria bacterium]MYK36331.1 mucoidy inhibitor MuiA family protein [Gammaproteobacteria bacterium]
MALRIVAFAAVALAAVSLEARAIETVDSSIDAVTVYPQGARVTRVARVRLAKGPNRIALNGLPGGISLPGVQVDSTSGNVEVRSVEIDLVPQRDAYNAEIGRLANEITELQHRIAAIDDDIATAELQLEFLKGIANDSAGAERLRAAGGQADIGSWRQALDMLHEGAAKARSRIREAHIDRRQLEGSLSVLERQLHDLRGRNPASARLSVLLHADAALDTDIRVHYLQSNAGWDSGYSAYLDTRGNVLRLTHEARVRQGTEEEWRDVQLVLSTSNPSGRMKAPEQDSRFLDVYDPVPWADSEERMLSRAMAMGEDLSATDSAARADTRRVRNSRTVSYSPLERASISNSADQAHTVPLTEYTNRAALVTRITPRQSAEAFLTARISNDSDLPLVAGTMRVFIDGAYVGRSTFPELLPGAETVLPMGPDRKIDVLAIDQGGEKGSQGILSSRTTELTDFLFEIVNRHSTRTAIEVLDYYPVSRDERIEVTVPRGATPPESKDFEERPGVIAWRKQLEPGENWRIVHQYEVSYPGNTVLAAQR